MAFLVLAGCITFIYYVLGGLSTTNIMRLIAGESTKINDPNCYCGSCGHTLPVTKMIPIFTMLKSGGKCSFCGSVIPKMTLYLEAGVFFMMTLISALFSFAPLGVILSFLAYHLLRWGILIKYGRREDFTRQYFAAVFNIFVIFLVTLFLSYLTVLL